MQYRDHAAQAHILQRWARRYGPSLERAIELRVWRFSRPPRWVRHVGPSCEQPWGWPRHLSWGRHYSLCVALYARAERFLRGDMADPCRGRARGWRSPGRALRKALRLGREHVDCGATAVAFVR